MRSPRLRAHLVGDVARNEIFDRSSALNRDRCLEPFIALREKLTAWSVQLDTSDASDTSSPAFELHLNVRRPGSRAPCYVLMLEPPQVWPANRAGKGISRYRKIFTWNDSLVDGRSFIKLHFPNVLRLPQVDGWAARDIFCCLIAGNKAAVGGTPSALYSERVRAIRWFERNAVEDFQLYGTGWDLPPARPGMPGKLLRRGWRLLSPVHCAAPFPSYRGGIASKQDVLTRARFSVCYENATGLGGYITEKIFDCFFSACVPVYWGADNIEEYVPPDCFVDRRRFRDTEELYRYLKAMSEAEYIGFQRRIREFLQSPKALSFGQDAFADTVANTIAEDLELQA